MIIIKTSDIRKTEVREIDYQEHIQNAINYIEEHLTDEISNAQLAQIAGYSEYHFLRIFREIVKLTPGDYIRKRRISEIAREMMKEKRPVSEIAFEYGFNSKENFTRAFKAEHHILPTEFKIAGNSLKLYDRITFDQSSFRVDGKLVVLEPFRLIAYKSDEAFPPNFWNKYNAKKYSEKLSGGAVVEDFGVSIWDSVRQKLDYYIGIPEVAAHGDLSQTVAIDIAGGLYAVFATPPATHFDFVNTIHRTWDYIGRNWLAENGYQRTGGIEFESYVEESRTFSEKIYIPVVRKREEL